MAGYVRVSDIKENLTVCPICTNEYDELVHLPRRMPCCVQAICHPCLEKIWNNNKLSCPLCRHEHTLPVGVTSLPIESLVLKILDHLKIQKGIRLPCTECSDGNEAQYRCDDCAVFLCEECHKAHARLRCTRNHKTVTFEEMKGRPVESFKNLHQCKEHQQPQQFYCRTCKLVICVSCTVVDHDKTKDHDVVSLDEAHQEKAKSTDDVINSLDQKVHNLERQVKNLKDKKTNIKKSRKRALKDVKSDTDNLNELLKKRRDLLVRDIEMKSDNELKDTDEALDSTKTLLAKVKSSTEYTRKMRERADKVEDLQLMVSSTDTLNTMLQETAQDVRYDRTGITFAPVQVTEIKAMMNDLGRVRKVTFNPTDRPPYIPADAFYNAVTMVPAELSRVKSDHFFSEGGRLFISPRLEFDPNTASDDVQISSGVVSNIRQDPAPQDTGCRLQSGRRALTLEPLPLRRGQVLVFSTRVVFTVKKLIEKNKVLWEMAVTSSPVDTTWGQHTGLSVGVGTCSTHKQQLCLLVKYNGKGLTDVALSKNQIGELTELYLCIMIDRDTGKIHVVDINKVKVVTTIPDVTLDRPLWVLMYVDAPLYTKMKSELISGSRMKMTQNVKQLLISLN